MRANIILLALMLIAAKYFGQTADSPSKLVVGFNVGVNQSNTQLTTIDPELVIDNGLGFRLGVLADWKFSKHFSFSPKAELSFNDSKLYWPNVYETITYQVYPVLMEFAAHLAYTFNSKKTAPYLLFGPTYKIPSIDKDGLYSTYQSDLSIDFGFGVDNKFSHFIFAPELRYSLGLLSHQFLVPANQVHFHTLTLVLNFKG